MKVHMMSFFLIITVFLFMTRIEKLRKYTKLLIVYQWENLFDFKDKYNLHNFLVNTELKGKNSISCFGAVI